MEKAVVDTVNVHAYIYHRVIKTVNISRYFFFKRTVFTSSSEHSWECLRGEKTHNDCFRKLKILRTNSSTVGK